MRISLAAVIAFAALPLTAANIRFDPPNPDSRTPVVAHVATTGCNITGATASRNGSVITVAIQSQCLFPFLSGYEVAVNLGALPPGVYAVTDSAGDHATLPVSDAWSDLRLRPNVIDLNGGDVHLTGSNLIVCLAGPSPAICNLPVVTIDGQPVAVRWDGTSTDSVIVRMPLHDAGIVSVRVKGGPGDVTIPFDYFRFDAEPEPAFFERVLLPVFLSDSGAYGSKWVTEAALYNGDPYPVAEAGGPFFTACHLVVTCPSNTTVPPAQTTFAAGASIPAGVVTFLQRDAMPNLHFSLRVRDLSRDATDFGTSVPVVREPEMFTRAFTLVNVPSDARYRLGLRLYADDTIPTTFHLTITPAAGGDVIDRLVDLLPAHEHAFAFIGDLLAEHPSLAGKGPLRIDITPLEPATRAWGYVAITNNDTQHVTVIAPE